MNSSGNKGETQIQFHLSSTEVPSDMKHGPWWNLDWERSLKFYVFLELLLSPYRYSQSLIQDWEDIFNLALCKAKNSVYHLSRDTMFFMFP